MNCRGIVCLILGAALLAPPLPAADYADSTLVDLFRRVNPKTGAFAVGVAWTGINNGGGVQYPAYYGVDRGNYSTQLGFPSQATNNAASYQVTLPEAVHIQTLQFRYGGHRAVQHRILGSLTGFGALTELVPWTNAPSDGPFTYTVNTNAQYVQFDFMGTAVSQYLLISEAEAFAGAADVIDIRSGYNLFYQRSAAGPITDSTGSWEQPRSQIIDLNLSSYLIANETGTVSRFVIPLNGLYYLVGAASGAYHGQGWPGGMIFEVTDAPTYDAGTPWVEVRRETAAFDSKMMPFAFPALARYVRVTHPGTWRGAMCELELYAARMPGGTVILIQ